MLILHTRNYGYGAGTKIHPRDDECIPGWNDLEKGAEQRKDKTEVSQKRCVFLAMGALFVSLGVSICVFNPPVGIMLILFGIVIAISPCVRLTKRLLKRVVRIDSSTTPSSTVDRTSRRSNSLESISSTGRTVTPTDVTPRVIYDPLRLPTANTLKTLACEQVLVRKGRRRSSTQSNAYLLYDAKTTAARLGKFKSRWRGGRKNLVSSRKKFRSR